MVAAVVAAVGIAVTDTAVAAADSTIVAIDTIAGSAFVSYG